MLRLLRLSCPKAHTYLAYPPILLSQISRRCHGTLYPGTNVTTEEDWKRRFKLRQPKLQRDEQVKASSGLYSVMIYYKESMK